MRESSLRRKQKITMKHGSRLTFGRNLELYRGQKRPAIVICPGGASMTSDREAEAVALRL